MIAYEIIIIIVIIIIIIQAKVSWDPATCTLTTDVTPVKGGKKCKVTRKIVNNELVMVNMNTKKYHCHPVLLQLPYIPLYISKKG